jgi:hypothetical protein
MRNAQHAERYCTIWWERGLMYVLRPRRLLTHVVHSFSWRGRPSEMRRKSSAAERKGGQVTERTSDRDPPPGAFEPTNDDLKDSDEELDEEPPESERVRRLGLTLTRTEGDRYRVTGVRLDDFEHVVGSERAEEYRRARVVRREGGQGKRSGRTLARLRHA